MNFLEEITLPFYSWDRRRGNTHNLSVFHCRTVITVILSLTSFDIYQFCCFVSKKSIVVFNRQLFDKNIDFYILGFIFFLISLKITSSKNWEEAYNNEETGRYDIVSAFLFLLSPGFILLLLAFTIK